MKPDDSDDEEEVGGCGEENTTTFSLYREVGEKTGVWS
jgi:hypothetical protein